MLFNECSFLETKELLENENCIIIPIFRLKNKKTLSAIIIYSIDTSEYATYNFTHPDLKIKNEESSLSDINPHNAYCYNLRFFKRYWKESIYDLELYYWYVLNVKIKVTFPIQEFYSHVKLIGDIIPFTKHFEYAQNIYDEFINVSDISLNKGFVAYSGGVYETLNDIVDNGIKLSPHAAGLLKIGNKADFIYTDYNILTKTGRPFTMHGNVNLLSLNKKDGIRKMIISRFEGGQIVNFDYDSFHLRLIAHLINFKLGRGSVHEEFGKIYFGKDILTKEEYELSKKITFKELYNDKLEIDTDFFIAVHEFKGELWKTFKNNGYVTIPGSERRIKRSNFPKMTQYLLLNYFIQGYETIYSLSRLKEINKLLEGYKSKIILYVFDSYLLDYNPDDGSELLQGICDIMTLNNFGVHVSSGKNYHDLSDITTKFAVYG